MAFTLKIKTDNASYEAKVLEVERILNEVIQQLKSGQDEGNLRDINGNTVGSYKLRGTRYEKLRMEGNMSNYYYHAGAGKPFDTIIWSHYTRRSRHAAEIEARRLARLHGGRPIIEWWPRECGLCPSDQEVISGADWLD